MRTLTIEYGDGIGGCTLDVVDEYGRRCNGLGWDEMLGQVVSMTHPSVGRPQYRMQTQEQWDAEHAERGARMEERRARGVDHDITVAGALRHLYEVSAAMDCELEGARPTHDEYQTAMREAKEALRATP